MNRVFAIALCALFAIHSAEARTLYVDAKRPNNNGNGLKVKTAKKTIQAAINIAQKGDTILVYPGTYAPIKTNNREITIKSTKGKKKTVIKGPAKVSKAVCLACLGRTENGKLLSSGKQTALTGFSIDWCTKYVYDGAKPFGVTGGTLKSCEIRNTGILLLDPKYCIANSYLKKCLINGNNTFTGVLISGSTLANCVLRDNEGDVNGSSLDDCSIFGNEVEFVKSKMNRCSVLSNELTIQSSTICNCLVANNNLGDNQDAFFLASKIYNCTIVGNLLSDVWWRDGGLAKDSKIYNAIFWNNTIHHPTTFDVYGAEDASGNARWVRKDSDEFGEDVWEIDISQYRLTSISSNITGKVKLGYRDYLLEDSLDIDDDDEQDDENVFAYTMMGEVDTSWDETCGIEEGDKNICSKIYTKKADPKFKNVDKGDYRLKKESPCIDKGKLTTEQKKLVGTKDLAGKKRIKGKAIDIGCYEY